MSRAKLIKQEPGLKHYVIVDEDEQCFCQSYYDDENQQRKNGKQFLHHQLTKPSNTL